LTEELRDRIRLPHRSTLLLDLGLPLTFVVDDLGLFLSQSLPIASDVVFLRFRLPGCDVSSCRLAYKKRLVPVLMFEQRRQRQLITSHPWRIGNPRPAATLEMVVEADNMSYIGIGLRASTRQPRCMCRVRSSRLKQPRQSGVVLFAAVYKLSVLQRLF